MRSGGRREMKKNRREYDVGEGQEENAQDEKYKENKGRREDEAGRTYEKKGGRRIGKVKGEE